MRISKLTYDPKYGDHPNWHHVKCFAEKRSEYLFFAGGDCIPGFKKLKKDDQDMVKNEIKYDNFNLTISISIFFSLLSIHIVFLM